MASTDTKQGKHLDAIIIPKCLFILRWTQGGKFLPKQGKAHQQTNLCGIALQEAHIALLRLAQPVCKVQMVLNWEEFGKESTRQYGLETVS